MPHRTLLSLSLAFLFVLLLHTPLAAAAPRAVPHQEREADDDDFFAEFTRPRAGDVLVTGSVAEVSWRTGTGEGHVMLEVAEGDPDLRHFVYVDYDLDYAPGAHNWTVPANLNPGAYSLRLASSSDPSVYADSPAFEIIHAAPAPTSRPTPPSGGAGSLTKADIIGLGVGVGVVGLLVVCCVWLFWRRRRRGRGVGTGRRSAGGDSGVGRLAFHGSGLGPGVVKTEEDKLPEGVVSAWAPEGRLSPVELPAEMLERMSGEARHGRTSSGMEGRLELSGSVDSTSIDEEVVESRARDGSLRRGDVDREGHARG